MPPDYGETRQYALVDAGAIIDDVQVAAGSDTGIGSGSEGGMGSGSADGGVGTDAGMTGDGGTSTGDGGTSTGDGGSTGGGDDGTGDGGTGGSGSQTPTGTPDNNANLDSFYACSAGGATGGAPLLLVFGLIALRRRRQR
jgi:MYXO-CTERM domain-containing protein